jgi:hypothetical protein
MLNALGDDRAKFASTIRYEEAANKNMSVTHASMIALNTGLSPMIISELSRRKIKIDRDEVNLAQPERMQAEARCWREIASALRKGTYKWKTFTCRL